MKYLIYYEIPVGSGTVYGNAYVSMPSLTETSLLMAAYNIRKEVEAEVGASGNVVGKTIIRNIIPLAG